MKNIKINTLSELVQAWKDNRITDKEAKEIFKSLSILTIEDRDIEPEEELIYIAGGGNSWIELRTDMNLNREERIEFKEVGGYI